MGGSMASIIDVKEKRAAKIIEAWSDNWGSQNLKDMLAEKPLLSDNDQAKQVYLFQYLEERVAHDFSVFTKEVGICPALLGSYQWKNYVLVQKPTKDQTSLLAEFNKFLVAVGYASDREDAQAHTHIIVKEETYYLVYTDHVPAEDAENIIIDEDGNVDVVFHKHVVAMLIDWED
jgi:hypothetical protein